MKYLYCIAIVSLLLSSCSAEGEAAKNEIEWVTINGVSVKKSDVELPRPKGALPYGHKVYSFMNSDLGLNTMDKIYREEFAHPDSLKLDYNQTARQMAFFFMMQNGLKEKGTPDQKQYYIKEQIAMDQNIAGIENFYELLASGSEIFDKVQLESLGDAFYDKHYKSITNGTLQDDTTPYVTRLEESFKKFESKIVMK